MALQQVLRGIDVLEARGADDDLPVGRVTDDSRVLQPGDLFVAVSGRTVDGHDYLPAAAEAGAAAVLVSRPVSFPGAVNRVTDTAEALGIAASNRAGNPAQHLHLVGLTGTNGKTTTTYVLESILEAAGQRPGVIGTVSYRFAGQKQPASFTTPTAPQLQSLLSEMVLSGCTHAVMEVSSHALEMRRVAGLDFELAGFTNFSQDHLDLHGSMEAYREAKRRLFACHLSPAGAAVLWHDDPASVQMVLGYAGRVVRVSAQDPSVEVTVERQESTLDGLRMRLSFGGDAEVMLRSPLVGDHNVNNIALAATLAAELGVDPETIARGVLLLKGVPGRLERVDPDTAVAVLVDYAHTPAALSHALTALRPLTPERLLCVFGCGGDRDAVKRPLMGRAVAEVADLAVVTSDNPRTEDPLAIIAQVLDGVGAEGHQRVPPEALAASERAYTVIPDRRAAIFAAVQSARPGDVVLVAGKGHEDYQILGRDRIHFDDREQSRAALASRRSA
jgi:UDP-N-acetylmuramyl-tripeptide synthetase